MEEGEVREKGGANCRWERIERGGVERGRQDGKDCQMTDTGRKEKWMRGREWEEEGNSVAGDKMTHQPGIMTLLGFHLSGMSRIRL